MAKGKGEENVQKEEICEALRCGSETIIQGVTGSKKEGTRDIFMFGLTKLR